MVEKRAVVRLSAEGGETVRAEFVSVGRAAKDMGANIKTAGQDAGNMATGMQKAVSSFAGIEAEQKSAATSASAFSAALAQEESRFKSLKAAIDPAYGAQVRYESAVQKVQRAQRLGITTTKEAEGVLELLERQYRSTGTATEQMMAAQSRGAGVSRAFAGQMQNASYQVGDFFVQVAAGTSASRALTMQLPQLLGGFGLVGAAAGAVAAILGALVPMMFQTRDAAESIDALSLDGARSAIQSLAELEDRYALAVRTRGIAQNEVSGRAIEAMGRELEAQRALLRVEEAKMKIQERQLRQDIAEQQAGLQREIDIATQGLETEPGLSGLSRTPNKDAALQATRDVLAANEDVTLELQRQNAELVLLELGLESIAATNRDGAAAVSATSAELNAQAGIQALIAEYGEDSVQVTQARAAAERDAYIEIVASSNATDDMKVSMIAAYDAANGIAGVDIASGISRGASEAQRLAAELGVALNVASQLAYTKQFGAKSQTNSAIRYDDNDPRNPDNNGNKGIWTGGYNTGWTPPVVARPSTRGGGGGGGGGSSSRGGSAGVTAAQRAAATEQNARAREAERIIASMRTETEKYNDELREMAELNKLGYFKEAPEAYARAVADLQGKLTEAEFGPMLDGMRSLNAELTSAIMGSGSLGDVFESQIKRMAESLISSGLDQLMMAAFGPIMGLGGNASAGSSVASASSGGSLLSFAGGGHTGRGARSGGLDGQGGFLAMLHPQERVVDEARGGGGGGMNLTVNITGASGDPHVIGLVRQGVSEGLSQYNKKLPELVNSITKDPRAR